MARARTEHVTVQSLDAPRFDGALHAHPHAQLIYAMSGVVTVTAVAGTWVVPPNRAVWVPAGVEHQSRSHRAVQFRLLAIEQADIALPRNCMVVEVSALLRELILRLATLTDSPEMSDFRGCMTRLLLQELSFLPIEPLMVPAPRHAGLARFCEYIQSDLARAASLKEASDALGMSRSTFMRLFHRETGLSFAHWHKQARLLHAVSLLAEGESVLNVALACGYNSPSAFSAMFQRSLGVSPREYFYSERGAG